MQVAMKRTCCRMFIISVLTMGLTACTFPMVGGAQGTADEPAASATPTEVAEIEQSDAVDQIEPQPSDSPIPTNTPLSPTPTETPSWVGPDSFPDDVNPLTGMVVTDPTRLERRPLAIKVSNFPAAGRPHSGLSFADLVFEYFIGEGMTRFLAFFYGQDTPAAGPIRSGRLVDGQLVRLYGGVLGMKGADGGTTERLFGQLPGRVYNAVPATCPGLCPYTDSHTYGTFSDTAAFTEYLDEHGASNVRPNLDGMLFDNAVPDGGVVAERIWLYYNYNDQVGWDYDAESGAYLRSQDPADGTAVLYPMTDEVTGEQLAFNNVVFMFTYHRFKNPTTIEIEMWYASERKVMFFRDGQMYHGTFSFVDEDLPLRFEGENGELFAFKPGNTWFQVVGLGTSVEELEPGYWKLRFYP